MTLLTSPYLAMIPACACKTPLPDLMSNLSARQQTLGNAVATQDHELPLRTRCFAGLTLTNMSSVLGRYYRGRGAFESMGAGIPMQPGDIAFKSNFATMDEKSGIVVRRRADRRFEDMGPILCAALDGATLLLPVYLKRKAPSLWEGCALEEWHTQWANAT